MAKRSTAADMRSTLAILFSSRESTAAAAAGEKSEETKQDPDARVEPADAAEKDPGIFTPLPMCVDPNTCPKCAACIESSSFCQGCGKKCGVSHTDPCRVPRHKLMFFATFVSVAGLAMLIAATCVISADTDVVKNVAWTVGTAKDKAFEEDDYSGPRVEEGILYIGLSSIAIFDGDKEIQSMKWSKIDCHTQKNVDACQTCKRSASAMKTTIIMGVVTQLPQILTDIQRSTFRGDANCQKVIRAVRALNTPPSVAALTNVAPPFPFL